MTCKKRTSLEKFVNNQLTKFRRRRWRTEPWRRRAGTDLRQSINQDNSYVERGKYEVELKRWLLALHCHLRPPLPPVIIGLNHETGDADPSCTSVPNSSITGQCLSQLLMIQHSFSGQ